MWVIGFERTKLLAFISRFDFVSVTTEPSNALTGVAERGGEGETTRGPGSNINAA